jgi:hypothetical protein
MLGILFSPDFFFNGDAVEKKKTRAIDKDKLRKGVWRLFPMTYHVFWRSLVLGIMFGAMYGGLSLAIFAAACTWGNSLCNVGFWGYTIFKACWACLGAALVHPLAFIGMCARERPVPVNKVPHCVCGIAYVRAIASVCVYVCCVCDIACLCGCVFVCVKKEGKERALAVV